MKKPRANRMHLFKNASRTTDYSGNANSRHIVHHEFEHIQDSEANQSQYIFTDGPAEDRLKKYLHANLDRSIDNLLSEFEWCKNYAKKS